MAWTRSGGRVASCLKSRGKIWGAVLGEMKGAEKRAEEETLKSSSVIGLRGTLHKMLLFYHTQETVRNGVWVLTVFPSLSCLLSALKKGLGKAAGVRQVRAGGFHCGPWGVRTQSWKSPSGWGELRGCGPPTAR